MPLTAATHPIGVTAMTAALIVSIITLMNPEPASFAIEIQGNKNCSVWFGENRLKECINYSTEPLYRNIVIPIEVRWVDGDEILRQQLSFPLIRGKHLKFRLDVPKGVPTVRLCKV